MKHRYLSEGAHCSVDNVRRRLSKGWCLERAKGVVVVEMRPKGFRYYAKDLGLKYVDEVTVSKTVNHVPIFMCMCTCGNFFEVSKSEMFYDVNCGCIPTGHTPSALDKIKQLESDDLFMSYCTNNDKASTRYNYALWKASKKCMTPMDSNPSRCIGRGYSECSRCVKNPMGVPDCFEVSTSLYNTCNNSSCSKRSTCVLATQPQCYKPVVDSIRPLCVGHNKRKCKECLLYSGNVVS